MRRDYAAGLLVAARLELARRDVFPWAAELRLFEMQAGPLPASEPGRPPAEALEAALGELSREQRRALRRLLLALGVRASPTGGLHGEGTEAQDQGCR